MTDYVGKKKLAKQNSNQDNFTLILDKKMFRRRYNQNTQISDLKNLRPG